MKLIITKHYGGVLIACGLLAGQQYYNAFSLVGPLRKMIFKETFMKNFEESHKMVFNTPPSPFGYPDMGAGRYSRMLPYQEWYKFNVVQRIHGNSVEHLSHCIPLMML
mmetsp:Transcript_17002/g.16690  ORF Transcript_17002/g.16690 Transcript_17002/m.16690 type:complete len:108 (-) Transcript_17002:329-652(-)